MFGINGAEFLVLLLVAVLVVGPERLPAYAEQLGTWVRSLRRFVSTAKERVATELGDEAADVDWASLDPRRYDPRRIVREALLDDPKPSRTMPSAVQAPSSGRRYTTGAARRNEAAQAAAGVSAGVVTGADGTSAGPAPFDDEAT